MQSAGDRFKLVNDSDSNWWHVMKLCDEGDKVPEHFYVPASYVELDNGDEVIIDFILFKKLVLYFSVILSRNQINF